MIRFILIFMTGSIDSQPLPLSSKQKSDNQESSLTIRSLPPELSRAIWQLSLSDNRVITIHWAYEKYGELCKNPVANDFHATYDKIEALEVFSESRTLALEDYKLCFSNDMCHPIYFNSNKDILKFINFTLAEITYFSHGDVWKTESVRDANVKRIAVELQTDVNLLRFSLTISNQTLLCYATLLFATLEKVFVQPSCAIDSSSEASFRATFEQQMQAYQRQFGPLWEGKTYNIPEIVFVCFRCDPNFSMA